MAKNITSILTNGTGTYALTAQEDNAILEVIVRAHKSDNADYGRVILFRSGSNFDRGTWLQLLTYSQAPKEADDFEHFLNTSMRTELSVPSLANLYAVGEPIVKSVRYCPYVNDRLL